MKAVLVRNDADILETRIQDVSPTLKHKGRQYSFGFLSAPKSTAYYLEQDPPDPAKQARKRVAARLLREKFLRKSEEA